MNLMRAFISGIRINKVIQFLFYSDVVITAGWGMINPIIAVFFTEQVVGGDIELAGLAATAYFLTKSLLQVPVARWIDMRKGEWDDFIILAIGIVIVAASGFGYIWVTLPAHVFAVQIINGIGSALYYPTWLAIFTRHVDKNEEGLEWSLYFTGVDLTGAITAGLGGLLVARFGYQLTFFLIGLLTLIGGAFILGIARDLKIKTRAKRHADLAVSA